MLLFAYVSFANVFSNAPRHRNPTLTIDRRLNFRPENVRWPFGRWGEEMRGI